MPIKVNEVAQKVKTEEIEINDSPAKSPFGLPLRKTGLSHRLVGRTCL